MSNNKYHPANWSVGTKISGFSFTLVGAILAALILTISLTTASLLEARAAHNVQNELRGVISTVELFNKTVSSEAVSFGRIFKTGFSGAFELDEATTVDIGGKPVPTLKHNGQALNLDFSAPDRFSSETGGNATIFAVNGDDFVRVTTSVKKENGERAVGTQLDRKSPAYAALKDGKVFVGVATLFGKQFITQYE